MTKIRKHILNNLSDYRNIASVTRPNTQVLLLYREVFHETVYIFFKKQKVK